MTQEREAPKVLGSWRSNRIKDLFAHHDEDENGCWIWRGAKCDSGYGTNSRGGKYLRMHRAYYEHFVGPIPDGLQVCHRCDVRLCVNPAHLFVGTNKENMMDRDRKGRLKLAPLGEAHNKAKLTEEQVLKARRMWRAGGRSMSGLAVEFGVHNTTMRALLIGKNWKNVGGLYD